MNRKIFIVALAVMASASVSSISAKSKKKQENKKTTPIALVTSSDTLSYTAGATMTQGLLPYLKQSFGVDSAEINDFIRGLQESIAAKNDKKFKAYAAGLNIASQLESRMIPGIKKDFTDSPDSISENILICGFIDALKNDTTHFTTEKAQNIFNTKRESDRKAKEEKLYGANRTAGEQFLAENAHKDSIQVTPSGLQYKILTKGNGPIPKSTDRVIVKYEGKLIDGTIFDSSYKRQEQTNTFRADQVIKGWTEALTMMPVGSKWQLFIPQQLAYGNRPAGQIKPYSALIFTVELIGIEGANNKSTDAKKETGKLPNVKAKTAVKKTAAKKKK